MGKDQNSNTSIIDSNGKKLLQLSQREGDIITLIGEGKSNREIAGELNLSIRTIENHRYRIQKKLGLKGRDALKRWLGEG